MSPKMKATNLNVLRTGLFLSISYLSMLGCDTASSKGESQDGLLSDIRWELRYISENGLAVEAPPVDTLFYINFNDENGFSAKDYCNVCKGGYSAENGTIEINNPACTLVLCVATKTNIQFAAELVKVSTYTFEDNELQLSYINEDIKRTLHLVDGASVSPRKVILSDPSSTDRDSWENGAYNAGLVKLEGDIVTLNVGYSGCGEKDVNMVFGNYFLESNPVQAHAFLPSVEEACLAVFSKDYTFDLSYLKESFNDFYPNQEGKINISIRENGETLEQFLYEF